MKRLGGRRRARYFGGGLATVALVALTLFVVLPALASNLNDKVPPSSGAGVMPVDVGIGGNGNCSNLFPTLTGVRELDVPNPVSGSYPSGKGWSFTITAGTLPHFNKNAGQTLAVDSNGNAAILGIGINGGTDSLIYDYRTTSQGFVTGDTGLHAPASKWTQGTNPETGITQYFGVSHLTVCYKTPLATISGNAYENVAGQPGIGGLTVTLDDTTTPGTQTATTDAGGNYSFSAAGGDNYTVCIQAPSFANVQTVPASDTGSCTGTKGYSITNLGSSNGSGLNFGFQPLGSVSGTVYDDLNVNGTDDAGDTGQAGWTINVYHGTSTTPVVTTTSASDGSYTASLPLVVGDNYTVCESPPSGDTNTWAQTEPRPAAATICKDATVVANTGALPNGGTFTPTSATFAATQDFGNADAVACTQPMGIDGYSIVLATCKPQTFSITRGIDPNNDNKPYVKLVVGDPTLAPVPAIEKVTFADPIVGGQPKYTGLEYTDIFPTPNPPYAAMPECQLDPRDPAGVPAAGQPDMSMATAYSTYGAPGSSTGSDLVLPPGATSCVIAVTITAPKTSGGDGTMVAYFYSALDSQAWPR